MGVVAEGAAYVDPSDVELPEVAEAGTVEWLTGPGASAVGLVTETAPLWTDEQPDCVAVATRLDELGTPAAMRDAVLETPDPVTAEVLLGLQTSVLASLAVCDPNDPQRAEHAWQWSLAYRRLVELGVLE